MKRPLRALTVLVTAVALLLGAGFWLRDAAEAPPSRAGTGAAQAGSTGSSSAGDGATRGGADEADPGGAEGKARPSGSNNPKGSELAPVDTTAQGEDTQPGGTTTPGGTPTPDGGLPGLEEPILGPLVKAPLPPHASRKGGLVTGFPKAIVLVPGSRGVVTSVSPGRTPRGDGLQVALDAEATRSVDAVLRYYRTKLARFGFRDEPVPAVGGSTGAAFTRPGQDRVVVTVRPAGAKGSRYTVFGTLHARAG